MNRKKLIIDIRKTAPDYCILRFTTTQGGYYCDLRTEDFDIQ
jgi:hypothetical protein